MSGRGTATAILQCAAAVFPSVARQESWNKGYKALRGAKGLSGSRLRRTSRRLAARLFSRTDRATQVGVGSGRSLLSACRCRFFFPPAERGRRHAAVQQLRRRSAGARVARACVRLRRSLYQQRSCAGGWAAVVRRRPSVAKKQGEGRISARDDTAAAAAHRNGSSPVMLRCAASSTATS